MKYEWVDGPTCTDAEWKTVDAILAARGAVSLNKLTTRILFAWSKTGELIGFNVLQLFPFVGPLFVSPSARGTGVAEELVDEMMRFLAQANARGFLVIAQSPHTERLCKKLNMQQTDGPVYIQGGRS